MLPWELNWPQSILAGQAAAQQEPHRKPKEPFAQPHSGKRTSFIHELMRNYLIELLDGQPAAGPSGSERTGGSSPSSQAKPVLTLPPEMT